MPSCPHAALSTVWYRKVLQSGTLADKRGWGGKGMTGGLSPLGGASNTVPDGTCTSITADWANQAGLGRCTVWPSSFHTQQDASCCARREPGLYWHPRWSSNRPAPRLLQGLLQVYLLWGWSMLGHQLLNHGLLQGFQTLVIKLHIWRIPASSHLEFVSVILSLDWWLSVFDMQSLFCKILTTAELGGCDQRLLLKGVNSLDYTILFSNIEDYNFL